MRRKGEFRERCWTTISVKLKYQTILLKNKKDVQKDKNKGVFHKAMCCWTINSKIVSLLQMFALNSFKMLQTLTFIFMIYPIAIILHFKWYMSIYHLGMHLVMPMIHVITSTAFERNWFCSLPPLDEHWFYSDSDFFSSCQLLLRPLNSYESIAVEMNE